MQKRTLKNTQKYVLTVSNPFDSVILDTSSTRIVIIYIVVMTTIENTNNYIVVAIIILHLMSCIILPIYHILIANKIAAWVFTHH